MLLQMQKRQPDVIYPYWNPSDGGLHRLPHQKVCERGRGGGGESREILKMCCVYAAFFLVKVTCQQKTLKLCSMSFEIWLAIFFISEVVGVYSPFCKQMEKYARKVGAICAFITKNMQISQQTFLLFIINN